MFLLKMNNFRKSATCPVSSDLLAFQKGEISDRESERITVHLRFCEFCMAEVEFYGRYPQAEELVEKAEIPRPLYELAEALLKKKDQDFTSLDQMLEENEFDY